MPGLARINGKPKSSKTSCYRRAGRRINSSQRSRGSSAGSSKRTLIEEELHDPELEAIKRKVAQRAHNNPLQPPNYVPPSKGQPMGLWLLIGGVVLAVAAAVLVIALR